MGLQVTDASDLGGKSSNYMPSYESTHPFFQRNAQMTFRFGSDPQHPHPAQGSQRAELRTARPLGWQVEVSVYLHNVSRMLNPLVGSVLL